MTGNNIIYSGNQCINQSHTHKTTSYNSHFFGICKHTKQKRIARVFLFLPCSCTNDNVLNVLASKTWRKTTTMKLLYSIARTTTTFDLQLNFKFPHVFTCSMAQQATPAQTLARTPACNHNESSAVWRQIPLKLEANSYRATTRARESVRMSDKNRCERIDKKQ